jgi:hypothetical protein
MLKISTCMPLISQKNLNNYYIRSSIVITSFTATDCCSHHPPRNIKLTPNVRKQGISERLPRAAFKIHEVILIKIQAQQQQKEWRSEQLCN